MPDSEKSYIVLYQSVGGGRWEQVGNTLPKATSPEDAIRQASQYVGVKHLGTYVALPWEPSARRKTIVTFEEAM